MPFDRVPWPSGQAEVCKTFYSSSNLLGTSAERRDVPSLFSLNRAMARYSKWIALLSFIALAAACLLPWTYHADIGKTFSGFYSEGNVYGKPGKLLLFLGGFTALSAFIPRLWMKRTALFLSSVNIAYAVKTYIVFGGCYQGYCPEQKPAIFLMLGCTILLFLSAVTPQGKVRPDGMSKPE